MPPTERPRPARGLRTEATRALRAPRRAPSPSLRPALFALAAVLILAVMAPLGARSVFAQGEKTTTLAPPPGAAGVEATEETFPDKEPAKPVKVDAARPTRKNIPTTPKEILDVLGWSYVLPFLLGSFIAVWFSIERLVVLRQARVIPKPFVERFMQHLEQGKLDQHSAFDLCEENGSPVAMIFAHGVRKWGKPSVEVEQAIIDGGERQVSQLQNHLRILNGVATISPLVGLLGTVTGMIQTFNDIAAHTGAGKEKELAAGISVALLTTAVGLIIAIPTLTLYMYFSGKVDTLVVTMDLLAQNVVQLISAEGLAERASNPSGSRLTRKPLTGKPAQPEGAVAAAGSRSTAPPGDKKSPVS